MKNTQTRRYQISSQLWEDLMSESKWLPPTGSLHVFQFDVDVALDVERQGCLAPGNHGSVDDAQGAALHRLPGFSQ